MEPSEMKLNCKPGDTARVVSGPRQNVGKVVTVVGIHPHVNGYSNPDGSIVECFVWQIEPSIVGNDGVAYDAIPDECLLPELPVHRQVFVVGAFIESSAAGAVAWELQGVFDDRSAAIKACTHPRHFYAPIEMNKWLPDETVVMPDAVYPKA